MSELAAVDRVEILVVVDNTTDSLSTNPKLAVAEWTGLLTGGRMRVLSGRGTCCAHHGLSLLISARVGSTTRTLLFDAGPEPATFLRNAGILGLDFAGIDTVVLSHGHWDHAGGLSAAIEAITGAKGGRRVDCYVHPGMFAERGLQRPNGEVLKFEPVPDPDALERAGANVISTREAQMLADGAFYLSGEIARGTSYESGFPGHVRKGRGESWEPDPLIMDERFVSVHVKDKGQLVFSACSHAGVVNVLTHARSALPGMPLYGVMGGLHLSGATEKVIPDTVADLRKFGLKLVAPAHCTGWRAVAALAGAFAEELVPAAVGKRFILG